MIYYNGYLLPFYSYHKNLQDKGEWMIIQWRDESHIVDEYKRGIYFVTTFNTKPSIEFYLKKENIDDPKDTLWRLSNTNFEHIKFVARDENHAKEISIDMIKRAIYQILGCVI